MNKKQVLIFLTCTLFLGFILRTYGIDFGLPFFSHPDEGKYLPKAVGMLSNFNFNPRYFLNPPFLTYIYAFAVCVYFVFWKIIALFIALPDFRMTWKTNPMPFYILARGVSAFLGAATCFLVYDAGKKNFNRSVGLISGAILAFCFIHVRDSHFAVNDIASVFFLMLAYNFMVNIWKNGKTKNYIISGLISGIAIATKYNVGLVIVSLITAHFLRLKGETDKEWRKVFIFGMFCFVGFSIGCPWLLLTPKAFFHGFLEQFSFSKSAWLGGSEESSYTQFIKVLLWGYGIAPMILALIGCVFLIKKKQKFFMLTTFPVVYYLLLGLSKLFFARFAIPLLPFLCILSAYSITSIGEYFGKNSKSIIVILTVIAIAQGLIFSLRHDYLLTKKDSRTTARRWIAENIPEGSNIVGEGFSPLIEELPQNKQVLSYNIKSVYEGREVKDLDKYEKEGEEYAIISDFIRKRYEKAPDKYPQENKFYGSLDKKTKKIYSSATCSKNIPFYLDDVITPFWNIFTLDAPGPCIRIYKIN